MRAVLIFAAGLTVDLANVMDLNGIRIELADLPPESDHRKAIERWQ